jgi:site-specific recombinase XerC
MLETLYGCGLRVSLVSLKISDLFFEEGFIKITGKGNKQLFLLEAWLRNTSIFIKAPLGSERKERAW